MPRCPECGAECESWVTRCIECGARIAPVPIPPPEPVPQKEGSAAAPKAGGGSKLAGVVAKVKGIFSRVRRKPSTQPPVEMIKEKS